MPNPVVSEQLRLLRAVMHRSKLSNRAFAERVMVRDERTIRRWLTGNHRIPNVVIQRLRTLVRKDPSLY